MGRMSCGSFLSAPMAAADVPVPPPAFARAARIDCRSS
jgi:hypothetical protein